MTKNYLNHNNENVHPFPIGNQLKRYQLFAHKTTTEFWSSNNKIVNELFI